MKNIEIIYIGRYSLMDVLSSFLALGSCCLVFISDAALHEKVLVVFCSLAVLVRLHSNVGYIITFIFLLNIPLLKVIGYEQLSDTFVTLAFYLLLFSLLLTLLEAQTGREFKYSAKRMWVGRRDSNGMYADKSNVNSQMAGGNPSDPLAIAVSSTDGRSDNQTAAPLRGLTRSKGSLIAEQELVQETYGMAHARNNARDTVVRASVPLRYTSRAVASNSRSAQAKRPFDPMFPNR